MIPLDLEGEVLSYLARDDADERKFQSLTTVYERTDKPMGWGRDYNIEGEHLNSKEKFQRVLDDMVEEGLLERRMAKADFEPYYRASEQGFYEAVIGLDPIVVDEQPRDRSFDSTAWTGLPKQGVLSEAAVAKLKIALNVVSDALEKSDTNNHEKAQARAYIIALHAFAEAPDPPADLVWQIIQRVGAIAGIAAFFVALVDLYK